MCYHMITGVDVFIIICWASKISIPVSLKIILSFKPIAAPKFNSSPLKTYQPKERIMFQKPFFTGYFTCQTSLRFFALESQDIDSAVDSCPKETVLEHYLQQSRLAQILPRHHISWPLKKKQLSGSSKNGRKMFAWKMAPPKTQIH